MTSIEVLQPTLQRAHSEIQLQIQPMTRAPTIQPTVESDSEDSEKSADEDTTVNLPSERMSAGATDNAMEGAVPHDDEQPAVSNTGDNQLNDSANVPKKAPDVDESDLKQVIREEIIAAFNRNENELDNEVEKRLEQEMRKRLARFGFQDNQIQAMINPQESAKLQKGMSPNNPLRSTQQPTYVKVHKDHLDVATLQYYEIPYELYSQDPNYIIILREMSQKETDILFEQTRRLRSRNTNLLFIEERTSKASQNYAFVRKRRTGSVSTSLRDVWRLSGAEQ
ncbi:hypothetical protein EJ04DRAFT_102361 [Polyplosphaeria fusca]|uniref:Uncharacterized protein n=1 Tax=Polyplosphaeria fusca TaxID=682080 RepID=A0A9P4R6C3_9PLEO|nr:hypothetical protein EJ04DRAFT_102361 [Polyplosphaeria fusca]